MIRSNKPPYRFAQNGFTLMEILIVVAIIGIIAAVALPAYEEQSMRGRRSDGKALISDLVFRQNRFHSQYVSYTTVIESPNACADEACGLGGVTTSPEGFYTAAIAATPAGCAPGGANRCRGYTITVTPRIADRRCTTLTFDNLGVRGSTGSATVDQCWR